MTLKKESAIPAKFTILQTHIRTGTWLTIINVCSRLALPSTCIYILDLCHFRYKVAALLSFTCRARALGFIAYHDTYRWSESCLFFAVKRDNDIYKPHAKHVFLFGQIFAIIFIFGAQNKN